jgi:hypothetical protein
MEMSIVKLQPVPQRVAEGPRPNTVRQVYRPFGPIATDLLVLGLAAFSFFVTCLFFLRDGALYWDNGQHFSQFRDNLHSLNAYGQIAWWFPHVQGGWPSYYYSILGFPHGASPLFGVVAFVCWAAGRLGLVITAYQPIYVVYFGLLTPALFLFALRAFLRAFLKSEPALVYALVLAAFSPGVVLNISDIGFLEPAAYGLFLGAAVLRFLSGPSRRTGAELCLTLVLLGLSLNFTFLFWNVVALPMFALLVFALAGRRRRAIVAALRYPGLAGWAAILALFAASALPNLVAYAQGHDTLIKPHLEGVTYKFDEILPGNPLTALGVSLPGFGSKWAPRYRGEWGLSEKATGEHLGYLYMGLMCLPLLLVGLIFGRAPVRSHVLAALLLTFGVVNLAAHSPMFAAVLALPTPLRSNNHYSDLLYRGGGFLVLLIGAALGFDALLRGDRAVRRVLLRLFLGSTAVALLLYAIVYEKDTLLRPSFGFSVLIAFLTGVILYKLSVARHRRTTRTATLALLALVFIDVSTHAFLHIRRVVYRGTGYEEEVDEHASPSGVGLAQQRKDEGEGYYFVDNVLKLRSRVEVDRIGVVPDIPPYRLFSAAHAIRDLPAEIARLRAAGFAETHSLPVTAADASHPSVRALVGPTAGAGANGYVERVYLRYNDVRLRVHSEKPALLFLSDSYSPYWRAEVDGRPVRVLRALHAYKAVSVPAGVSQVDLHFSPPWIGFSLFLGYAALIGMGIHVWRLSRETQAAAA